MARDQPGNRGGTFPAGNRANPRRCLHMARDGTLQVPPRLQLPARSAAQAGLANCTVSADGLAIFPPSQSRPTVKESEASNTGDLISEDAT